MVPGSEPEVEPPAVPRELAVQEQVQQLALEGLQEAQGPVQMSAAWALHQQAEVEAALPALLELDLIGLILRSSRKKVSCSLTDCLAT